MRQELDLLVNRSSHSLRQTEIALSPGIQVIASHQESKICSPQRKRLTRSAGTPEEWADPFIPPDGAFTSAWVNMGGAKVSGHNEKRPTAWVRQIVHRFRICTDDEGPKDMSETTVIMEQRTHEQKLDLLAEVAVRVGLGLRAGQELVMTASLDSLPLARRITEQAYRAASASLVTALYSDDEAALMRYHFASDESFDHAAKWLYDGMGAAFKSGAARLAIAGGNPTLLFPMKMPGRWVEPIARCPRHTDPRLQD